MKKELSSWSDHLRLLRESKQLTLRTVEMQTGVSNAYLCQMESGKVKQPSPVVLYKLSQVYEIPYEILMEEAGYPVPRADGAGNKVSVFNRLGKLTSSEEQALAEYLSFIRNRKFRDRRKR